VNVRQVSKRRAAGGDPDPRASDAQGAVIDDAWSTPGANGSGLADAIRLPGGRMKCRRAGPASRPTSRCTRRRGTGTRSTWRWAAGVRDGFRCSHMPRHQVVNVARGGTGEGKRPRPPAGPPPPRARHELDAESPLRKGRRGDRLTIYCYHHQAWVCAVRGCGPRARIGGKIEA